jgi:CheY-like chemotaxis protein
MTKPQSADLPGSPRPNPDLRGEGDVDLSGVAVLVVEDDRDSLELVEVLLRAQRAEVIGVSNAAAALDAIELRRPDVLVSDIGMSGMNGYRLLEEIRRRDDARGRVFLPALALTAFDRTEDMTRAGRAGYQRHLSKPFDPERLLLTVAELAGRGPRDPRRRTP